jgi:hypothetical protein
MSKIAYVDPMIRACAGGRGSYAALGSDRARLRSRAGTCTR